MDMSVTLLRCWRSDRNHRAWADATAEDFHYALCLAGNHHVAELNDQPINERKRP